MEYRPDLVIFDRAGAPAALVEVKSLSSSVETATRYLRNLFTHGMTPLAQFVVLVTPETGYIWETPEAILRELPPAFTFPMARITRHYLRPDDLDPVRERILESIVTQWLSDLADGKSVDDEVTSILQHAGFVAAIRGGLVASPALR